MRITGIRYSNDKKVTEHTLNELCSIIASKMERAGFITGTEVLNSSAIKVGLHMSSFRINTSKLGHNARVGKYVSSPKGYKRTDVPTWDQRVEFNNIVNSILDKNGIKATIKSGCFTVRDKVKGAHIESDWENQTPIWMGYHGKSLFGSGEVCAEIMEEAEARDRCNSDRLEAEHKLLTADARRETARAYRERMKLFLLAKRVCLAGFYGQADSKNGTLVTHARFEKILAKLSCWEKRRVKLASISATIASFTSIQEPKDIAKSALRLVEANQ